MGSTNQNIYNVNYQGVETNLTPPNHRTPKWLAWLNVLLYPLQWLHNNFFIDYANGSTYPFYSLSKLYNIGDRVIDINNAAYECEFNNVFNYSPHLNIGLAVGSYLFESGGGTDNLGHGTQINFDNFTGPNGTSWHVRVATSGLFIWDDNQGNNNDATYTTITPGVPTLLSYGVTITWGGGTPVVTDAYYFTASTNTIWWLVNPDYRGVRPRTNFNGQKLVLEGILNQFFNNNTFGIPVVFRQPATLEKPDIYIGNNQLLNFVFVVGSTENESSDAVAFDNEAITFVESSTSDYNFNGNAFTIYVPHALYYSFAPAGIGSIVMDPPGFGYTSVPTVTIGGDGTGAEVFVRLFATTVLIILINPGSGYTYPPPITISSPGTGIGKIPAKATATLGDSAGSDNIIRAVANRYVIAGMLYNIQPY